MTVQPGLCRTRSEPEDRFSHNEAQLVESEEQIRRILWYWDLVMLTYYNIKLDYLFSYADWFVSNLVGKPEDRFSHDTAQVLYRLHAVIKYSVNT